MNSHFSRDDPAHLPSANILFKVLRPLLHRTSAPHTIKLLPTAVKVLPYFTHALCIDEAMILEPTRRLGSSKHSMYLPANIVEGEG